MECWIEKDCVFKHEGRKYESGGASVTLDHIIAYLGKDGVLTDWHGNPIGTYRITATWKTPRSYVSSTMNQVIAYTKGISYTGRSAGEGMVFRGKRVAKQ
jgi:hypothetical protein